MAFDGEMGRAGVDFVYCLCPETGRIKTKPMVIYEAWLNGRTVHPGDYRSKLSDLTEDEIETMKELYDANKSFREIAILMGKGRGTLVQTFNRIFGKQPPRKPLPKPKAHEKAERITYSDIKSIEGAGIVVTFETIINAVLTVTALTKADFISSRRSQSIVKARFVAWYLGRKYTRLSLPTMGRFSGDRDHATILHGMGAVNKRPEAFAQILTQAEKIILEQAAS